MQSIDKIPVLKLSKVPMSLPFSTDNKSERNVVFLFSNSDKESVLKDIWNNKFIQRKMKYNLYYIPYKYNGTFYKRRYRLIRSTERLSLYRNLSSNPLIKSKPIFSFSKILCISFCKLKAYLSKTFELKYVLLYSLLP